MPQRYLGQRLKVVLLGFIYAIYNDINNKQYIGKTSHTVEYRFNLHKRDYPYFNYPLYNAMKKYGVDHFFIKQLEECNDEMLSEREMYYIDKFDTYKNGYNATLGGEGIRKYDYDEILTLWNDGFTIKAISRKIGANCDVIGKILGDLGVPSEERLRCCYGSNRKTVAQYDLNENLIALFPSASEAARQVHLEQSNISSCCRGKIKTYGGYKWLYVDDLLSDEEKDELVRKYRKVS